MKIIVVAVCLVLVATPGYALTPKNLFDMCEPLRNQGDLASNVNAMKQLHQGTAYLAAVIDSLKAEGSTCDVKPGFDTCIRYRDYVLVNGAYGKNAFPYARRMIAEVYNCR